MPFILAYLDSPVPSIPGPPGTRPASRERQEYFGTEEAALRRVAALLPAPSWLDLRLYGPNGGKLAGQAELARRCEGQGAALDPLGP